MVGNAINFQVDQTWLCPDLRNQWQLGRWQDGVVLRSRQTQNQWIFSTTEGYVLQHFTGQFTVEQVQQLCQQKFPTVSPALVTELIVSLIEREVLIIDAEAPAASSLQLKPGLQWFHQADSSWIFRNPECVTHQMQVSDRHKRAIEQLGTHTPAQILQQSDLNLAEFRTLLQQLAATGMLVGTEPAKRPKRKFTPLQLLSFTVPLCNPDAWLSRYVCYLRWIWTPTFTVILSSFLVVSIVYGWRQNAEFLQMGMVLWTQQDIWLMLTFGLLIMLVISLHELGHAFTLKHFDRIVPEIGLMFMCFMPSAITNTTDQYTLKPKQRALVVGAGVICQVTIAAIGFWLWRITNAETWLHTTSYLLIAASLMTVAINLNPLAKFDGYYLAIVLTGINNLRSRSFNFYANLLRRQPLQETLRDRWILAIYAPFSLAYTLMVMGFLLTRILGWTVEHIPAIAGFFFVLWAVYYYFPSAQTR